MWDPNIHVGDAFTVGRNFVKIDCKTQQLHRAKFIKTHESQPTLHQYIKYKYVVKS